MSTPATNNDLASLSRKLNDQCISVTHILWLATLDPENTTFEPVEDFFEFIDAKEVMEIFGLSGKRTQKFVDECLDAEDYGELIRQIAHIEGKKGLLLCLSWGSIVDCSDDMKFTSLCGTTSKWFYTDLLNDEFIERSIDQVEALQKKKCKRILEEKAAGGEP